MNENEVFRRTISRISQNMIRYNHPIRTFTTPNMKTSKCSFLLVDGEIEASYPNSVVSGMRGCRIRPHPAACHPQAGSLAGAVSGLPYPQPVPSGR